MARNIILEMLEDLNIDEASVKDIEMYVFDTMKKDSVTQIIDDLLAVLPYEPDDKQQNILEIVAEKLYALKVILVVFFFFLLLMVSLLW